MAVVRVFIVVFALLGIINIEDGIMIKTISLEIQLRLDDHRVEGSKALNRFVIRENIVFFQP